MHPLPMFLRRENHERKGKGHSSKNTNPTPPQPVRLPEVLSEHPEPQHACRLEAKGLGAGARNAELHLMASCPVNQSSRGQGSHRGFYKEQLKHCSGPSKNLLPAAAF